MHRATIRAAGGIRSFRVSSHAPHSHGRGIVQDGPQEGPTPEVCPDVAPIVRRMFHMVEAGNGPELIRTPTTKASPVPGGELWRRTSDHDNVIDEVCTVQVGQRRGTVEIWGGDERIAVHPRAQRPGQRFILPGQWKGLPRATLFRARLFSCHIQCVRDFLSLVVAAKQ